VAPSFVMRCLRLVDAPLDRVDTFYAALWRFRKIPNTGRN